MIRYILFFTILLSTKVFAEVVNKISIEGNQRFSDETVKVYGNLSINKNYTNIEINDALKNLYSTNFFKNIEIKVENGVLMVLLEEYPIINDIKINGEETKKITKLLLEQINLKANGSFIKDSLNKDIILIKKIYASLGYNSTQVNAKVENFTKNRLNLYFFVDKGKKNRIAKINFIGDKKIKDRRLRDVIVSEEHKFWKFISRNTNMNDNNLNLDKRLLVNYYKSIGYYDVQIVSSSVEIEDSNLTTITFNIDAGIRYKVTKISTDVSQVFDKKLFFSLEKSFKKLIGKYYSPFKVKKLLDDLDTLIDDNDLQFVKHSVNEIISGKEIEIIINIEEDQKLLVERINIKGNTVTEENVIRAELLLDEGEPFNNLKLEKSIAEIKARKIFGDVTKKVLPGSADDLKIIDIIVEEAPTGEISAGAGIGTDGGSFAFDVSENNWMGRGIKVSTYIDAGTDRIKGSLNVTQPNYNYTGNDLFYGLSSEKNELENSGYENSVNSVRIGTAFEQYTDIFFSPSLELNHDDLRVNSTGSASMKKQAGTFTDFTGSYSISKDLRDRAFMPTDGSVTSFSQTLPIFADAPYIRNAVSYSRYNSFNPNIIGAIKFYGAAVNGIGDDDVRISKRLRIPSSRLRGFKNGKIGPKDGTDYVGGNYAAAINLEAALPNLLPETTKTEVGVFLDAGNNWGLDYDSTIDDSNKIRSSVGVNASWISPLGPMSFIFSQNITKAATDSTETFNFKLGTTF
jgi:outer membrane protein insertion porin family